MRIYTNEKHIAKRAKLGRRTSMAGLLILMLGMAASFAPGYFANKETSGLMTWLVEGGWVFVSMGALLAGFLLGQIGNANVRRYQAFPRADQVISKALKGFDDRNHFYAWATPADLVFAGPAGTFAFATRGQGGQITIEDGKIKQPFSIKRFIFAFGQEPTGMPGADAQSEAHKLAGWLNGQLETGDEVEVKPVVVFINDDVQLDVRSSDVPIIHYKQLKQFLRGELRSNRASKQTMGAIIETLDAEAERRGVEPE